MFCFLISVYPCCILDECESTFIEVTKENKTESNECGSCSPFISCGVCAGFVPNHQKKPISYIVLPVKIENSFGFNFNCAETGYSEQLWQPPKKLIIS